MAFDKSNNTNAGSNNAPAAFEKAAGYLNFYLPGKDGKNKKVGAIPLKESDPKHKSLLDWLNTNPEENAVKLLAALVMEYTDATPKDDNQFVLPV